MKPFYKLLSSAKQGLFVLALTVFSGMAYSQTTYTFNYTGAVQTMNLSAGAYSIAMWGADGGNGTNSPGGKGGYSQGTLTVVAPAPYYIYVGGMGPTGGAPMSGGWNGGGNFLGTFTSPTVCGTGGGGTDIRTTQNTTYANRIIVAGGGGGGNGYSNYTGAGGNGGGISGQDGTTSRGVNYSGGGGTAVAGGTAGIAGISGYSLPGGLGIGGDYSSTGTLGGTAGGGGYYGGGSGHWGGSGGGGSSYIGGVTSGTTIMVGQPGFVSKPIVTGDGYVLITELCGLTVNASTNPICYGAAVTLTTSAGNVNWSTGAAGISTIIVTPSVTTNYTLFGVGSNGSATCTTGGAITVTVFPLPSLTSIVTPTLVCVGGTSSVTPIGAVTYSLGSASSNSLFIVNTSANTTYSFAGTSALGCVNTQTFTVKVSTASLNIAASSPSTCAGSPVNLTASGVNTYSWNNGSHFQTIAVNPTIATTYSVAGRDANYCLLTNVIAITTQPKPNVTLSSDKVFVCKGESVVLTAGGANTYVWSQPGASGTSNTVMLPVDVVYNYNVIGTDANGCKDTAFVSVTANKCAGINEVTSELGLRVYPNPTKGEFMIESANSDSKTVVVTDVTGKVVLEQTLKANVAINMTSFASGIYYVKVQSTQGVEVLKVVKE